MREAFDRTFARPLDEADEATTDLLAVRIGGRPYALLITDLAFVQPATAVTRVPTSAFALLGLTQAGTRLVPAYDLRALLGHQADAPPGCFVVTAGEPVAMGIDAYEQHQRVPRDSIVAHESAPAAGAVNGGAVVEADGSLRPIVPLRAVLETIRARATGEGSKDEVR